MIKEKQYATCIVAHKEREVRHMFTKCKFTMKFDERTGMMRFFRDDKPISVENVSFEEWYNSDTDCEDYLVVFDYHGVRHNLANDVYDEENDVWYDIEDRIWCSHEYLWYDPYGHYWYDRDEDEIIPETEKTVGEVLENDLGLNWFKVRSHKWLTELQNR